ncbi:hypothetical protein MTO96_012178 [Rhipicephalus appendiculatus]
MDPEDFGKDSGWITATARRSTTKSADRCFGANSPAAQPSGFATPSGRDRFKDVKGKVLKGSRMPPLPKDETNVVVRPRGGLSICKAGPTAVAEAIWFAAGIYATEREWDTMCPKPMQNVLVVRTPDHGNALRFTAVESIVVAGQPHHVSAYVATPQATCKGVIRRISNGDGPEVTERNIVNRRNPLALGGKADQEHRRSGGFVRRLQGSELCRLRRHSRQVHSLPQADGRMLHLRPSWTSFRRVSVSG